MKRILFLLLLALLPFVGSAQLTTINPDTVCYQTPGSIYEVTNVPGNTYTWTVSAPGVLVSGQGTNTINVDWTSAAPGLIPGAISVFATTPSGCVSPPVVLDVFILNIVPTFALGPFCVTDPCVPLAAIPSDGTWVGTGIVGNQFCPPTAGAGTFNVTYTYTLAGCTFSVTNPVLVSPQPTISPISHN
jgi:hypothetical protein